MEYSKTRGKGAKLKIRDKGQRGKGQRGIGTKE